MSTLWSYAASFAKDYGIGAALIAVVVLVLREWLKRMMTRRVDTEFNRQLDSHRNELRRVLEHDKFELQRSLAAGNLFMQRQHEAAAEAYDAIRLAHGAVGNLLSVRDLIVKRDASKKDLVDLMEANEIHGGRQDAVLAQYEIEPEQAYIMVEATVRSDRLPRASNVLQNARNVVYRRELYFSAATRDAFDAFSRLCGDWIYNLELAAKTVVPYSPKTQQELNEALDVVQDAMRAELTDPTNVLNSTKAPATLDEANKPRRWWIFWR